MTSGKCLSRKKKEFEQLEQEIAGLEQEKADIEAALCSGTLGSGGTDGEIQTIAGTE